MRRVWSSVALVAGVAVPTLFAIGTGNAVNLPPAGYAVFGFNDLGMHCTQEDFSEMCILPPYNTLRVQVVKRAEDPDIVTSGVTVSYSIPGNTHSFDKTNFWKYAPALFGVTLPIDVGLTGHGLSGTLSPAPGQIWEVSGIPITPTSDTGKLDPYPVAQVLVTGSAGSANVRPVVPVSSEMSCALCHGGPGVSIAGDILQDHDDMHGTNLVNQKPVLCASCHADPALGAPGQPGIPTLSHAMHTAHAERVEELQMDNKCYACHPGIRTQCQRDVHAANGVTCVDCHGGMAAVGNPNRQPWKDEPRCGTCHSQPGFQFEQANTLYKDSIGHSGIHCTSCHGSPHAITATTTAVDNQQAITLQGHAGVINTCTVCHTSTPGEPFFHKVND